MNKFLKTEDEIEFWLRKYEVSLYTLVPDEQYGFVVDAHRYVDLKNRGLDNIPVKFNTIGSSFSCSGNNLTSLDFAPKKVFSDFNCSNNKLTSLKGCPQTDIDEFNCSGNQLTSLEFCPKNIKGAFNCANNKLISLKFCPTISKNVFDCSGNQLTSLEFCPKKVKYSFYCSDNNLISLEFCPQFVGEKFECKKNPLLGKFQNIDDFSIIKEIHKTTKLHAKLEAELINKTSKSHPLKIKI